MGNIRNRFTIDNNIFKSPGLKIGLDVVERGWRWFIMPFNQIDKHEVITRFIAFTKFSEEQRLEYFDFVAGQMCSEEWRETIRQFVKERYKAGQELIDKVFDHLQLGTLEGNEAVGACSKCRAAFWRLIWLSTDVDGH
jgi:hypothetical protein